jgi:hypothetical protein
MSCDDTANEWKTVVHFPLTDVVIVILMFLEMLAEE